MGALFPLRNVTFPYIGVPAVVQDDIYQMYASLDVRETAQLFSRYGCTHLFYSDALVQYGGFTSQYRQGAGVEINKEKFRNPQYFEEVYRQDDIVIVRLKER